MTSDTHALGQPEEQTVKIVAHEEIPDAARELPTMRKRGFVRPISRGGGVSHWIIVEGEKEFRVEKLSPEQSRLSIESSWNLNMLIKKLTEGWLPQMDSGLGKGGEGQQIQTPDGGIVRHFLYFQNEAAARQMLKKLPAGSWSAEVKLSANGRQWLVLVADSHPTQEAFLAKRNELENLASEFGGEYDGWEIKTLAP